MRIRRKCESSRKPNREERLDEKGRARKSIPCIFDATSVELIEGEPFYTCPQHGSARHKRSLEEDEKWIEVEEPEPEPEPEEVSSAEDDLRAAMAMDLDVVERHMMQRVEEGLPFPTGSDGNALRLLFVRLRHAEREASR